MVKLFHTSWMRQLEFFHWDDNIDFWVPNDNAPSEIKEEYRLYWEEIKYWSKREAEIGAKII